MKRKKVDSNLYQIDDWSKIDRTIVSIIIPMYNAERYIVECLKSCSQQSYTAFQIVLVDDNSNDNSVGIAKDFLKNKKNLNCIIIRKNVNTGVSSSRNLGMKYAKGKYLYFLDADDILDEYALEILIKIAEEEECKLVFGKYRRFVNSDEIITNNQMSKTAYKIKKIDIDYSQLQERVYAGTIWGGLILSEIVKKNELQFDEELSYGEDTLFKLNLLKYVEYLVEVDCQTYWWRIRPDSLSARVGIMEQIEREVPLLEKTRKILIDNREYNPKWSCLLIKYFRAKKNAVYRMCINDPIGKRTSLPIDGINIPVKEIVSSKYYKRNILELIYSVFPFLDKWRIQKYLFFICYKK